MAKIMVSQDLRTFRCQDCDWEYVYPLIRGAGLPLSLYVDLLKSVQKMHDCGGQRNGTN